MTDIEYMRDQLYYNNTGAVILFLRRQGIECSDSKIKLDLALRKLAKQRAEKEAQ